jgi:hypothetical protein
MKSPPYSHDRAAFVESPMQAPQARRSVSQQLLKGQYTPSVPQVHGFLAQVVSDLHTPQLPALEISQRRFTSAKDAQNYLERVSWRLPEKL